MDTNTDICNVLSEKDISLFRHILSQRRFQIIISISLIVILTFISFLSSLGNDFVWNDTPYVLENQLIKNFSWENTKTIFKDFNKSPYHREPIVAIFYSLEYYLFNLTSFVYHFNNLILHIINSLLIFWIVFIISKNTSISFITAALFGIHPLHVEPVAWISERKDVLSTFFYLQAIIYYLQYSEKNKWFYYHLSLFVFVLALLSKSMAVTLPFIFLLFDYLSQRKIARAMILEKLPYFIISFAFGIIIFSFYHSAGQIIPATISSPFDNFLIACKNIVFYLIKTILPLNLSAYYPYSNTTNINDIQFFLPLIFLSILLFIVFYSRKYTRKVLFGVLFFLVTILPVLKLVPFKGGGAAMADRYMYIPSIGLFYLAGLAFYKVYTWEGNYGNIRRHL